MEDCTRINRLIKVGATMFFLWGVLHVYAGYLTAVPFFTEGPGKNLGILGVEIGAGSLDPALVAAGHLALNFGIDLAGYGVLAIWFSWFLWRGKLIVLSFWVNTVMLGIADAAFIYSLLVPGYSPILEGLAGPILYTLGVLLTALGIRNLAVPKHA